MIMYRPNFEYKKRHNDVIVFNYFAVLPLNAVPAHQDILSMLISPVNSYLRIPTSHAQSLQHIFC